MSQPGAQCLLSCRGMKDDVFGQVRIVPVGQIGTFEWKESLVTTDPNVVRHPLLAIRIEDGSFLLLEETDLFESLRQSGVGHVPLQVCPADQVRLTSGHLLVTGFGYEDLTRLVAQHPEKMVVDADTGRPEGCISVTIEFPDRKPLVVHMRHSTRLGCPAPLEYLFRSIFSKGRYLPELDLSGSSETPLKVVVPSARLTIPKFSIEDLITASISERYFPPGIVKASAGRRVLHIDFPLSVLRSDRSTAEIESFLKDLIFYREQSCKTSFFEGQVYILNR